MREIRKTLVKRYLHQMRIQNKSTAMVDHLPYVAFEMKWLAIGRWVILIQSCFIKPT